eukprot:3570296-Pleurochrysis_carterae.AAC.1
MITCQDFGSGFCAISEIGIAASRSLEAGISVVGASGLRGVWNNGGPSLYLAAVLACGEVGSAFGGAFGALPKFVGSAKLRLGS